MFLRSADCDRLEEAKAEFQARLEGALKFVPVECEAEQRTSNEPSTDDTVNTSPSFSIETRPRYSSPFVLLIITNERLG